MSFNDLLANIDHRLAENLALVIDDAEFMRLTNHVLTRKNCNNAAWKIIHKRPHLVAAAETFLHAETFAVMRVYLVCAKSRIAYELRVGRLQRDVTSEFGAVIKERVFYDHPHEKEPTKPAPLKTPKKPKRHQRAKRPA